MAVKAIVAALACLAAFASSGCEAGPQEGWDPPAPNSTVPREQLGLMTSLPLYWPLDARFDDLAAGTVEPPWQRIVIERDYELVPLDTLSPIPGLSDDAPETDPLEGLERLAVIQPRGLSPADNVALDDWVRKGGHLLIALDPLLTGDYAVPLGDPRRPNDTALIPPVIARWGLSVSFDADQGNPELGGAVADLDFEWGTLTIDAAGAITAERGGAQNCTVLKHNVMARCQNVGEGTVTVMADAAIFEHEHSALPSAETQTEKPPLLKLLRYAFETR